MGNYNLKNITLGLGIGLVISSMININLSSKEFTVEEIKKEAEKHNLIVLTKEEIINNQTPTATPSLTPTPTIAPVQKVTPVTTPIPTQKPVASAPTEGKIRVVIKSGMSSEDIANVLKNSGVIKDTKAFLKRLGETDKDDKLKIGSFDIPKNSGYDDIIKILTK